MLYTYNDGIYAADFMVGIWKYLDEPNPSVTEADFLSLLITHMEIICNREEYSNNVLPQYPYTLCSQLKKAFNEPFKKVGDAYSSITQDEIWKYIVRPVCDSNHILYYNRYRLIGNLSDRQSRSELAYRLILEFIHLHPDY